MSAVDSVSFGSLYQQLPIHCSTATVIMATAEASDTQTTPPKGAEADSEERGEETDVKPSGPSAEQEKKGWMYMEQASKKVKSASSFLGGLLGYVLYHHMSTQCDRSLSHPFYSPSSFLFLSFVVVAAVVLQSLRMLQTCTSGQAIRLKWQKTMKVYK